MKRTQDKGMALVNVLFLALLVLVLTLMIVMTSTVFFNFDRLRFNTKNSEKMAKSVVALGIAQLKEDPEWGKDGLGELVLEGEGWPGRATLSFKPGHPYPSVYNYQIDSDTVKGTFGTFVPGQSVQLVGVGEVNGKRSVYEVIVRKSGLDYALASSGAFSMEGQNEAAGLDNLQDFRDLDVSNGVPQNELLKTGQHNTNIATSFVPNDPSTPGMEFQGNLVLYGNALAAGKIAGADSSVSFQNGGKAQEFYQKKIDIPEIEPESYDPKSKQEIDPKWINEQTTTTYSDTQFEGFYRWGSGSQVVMNGDISLSKALLYVDGDLTINGSLKGVGAVVCTGNLTIIGHSDLSASSQLAVMAGKDLTFRGTTKSQSLFTGLMYSEGELDIANLTVVGAALANNPDNPEAASINVEEVTLVNQADAATFDLQYEVGQPEFKSLPALTKLQLQNKGIQIVEPDINDFIDPATGGYNNQPLTFQVKYTPPGGPTVTYNSIAEAMPNLPNEAKDALSFAEGWANANWQKVLDELSENGKQEVQLFQLDPNTLLSEAARVKLFYSSYHNG